MPNLVSRQTRGKETLALLLVVVIWSMCWSVNKIGLNYAPPLLFTGMRSVLGGVILGAFLLPQWREIQWKKYWHVYVIVAFFNTIVFSGVQTIGLQYLPSGLFSVIVYIQPVLVVLFAKVWLKELVSLEKLAGLLVGFLGVIVVSTEGMTGTISLTGILLAILSAIGWAAAVVYMKKTSSTMHALWLVALQLIIGGIVLSALGAALENISEIVWSPAYSACLLFVGVLGGAGATAVYFKLMSTGEASRIGSYIFLVPLLAVVFGSLFLNEPISLSLLGGMSLILLSIYFINKKKRNR